MIDQIGQELDRRWAEPWPWRSSLGVALALHSAVAVAILVAPSFHRRPLALPSVQVRLGVVAPQPPPAPARSATTSANPSTRSPVAAARPEKQRAKPAVPEPRQPRSTSRAALPAPTAAPAPPPDETAGSGAAETDGETRSATGALGVSSGGNSGDENFPYAYYLTRLLGLVESNWFRPPSPAGTRCRILCRFDRTGRLLDTGIEEASGTPTFDRAALRAVYASAPFPPLPQGWVGSTLTLHLEFGP